MYLFYIDESGEREYSSPKRYFALAGLGIPDAQWRAINSDMLTLKRTYFNDIDVEIKSNWLRMPKERQKRYLDKYPLNASELVEFTEKAYDILLSYNAILIAVIIDKQKMQRTYSTPQSPSSLAYRLLIERIEAFLAKQERHGVLIFDKITDLEINKKGYENLLARQHQRYLEKGTEFVQISQIIEGLLFIPSHENNQLQLVDLCAYNVYRQFTDYGEEWQKKRGFTTKYSYFERIEGLLDRSASGRIDGYGLKLFPS
jgi:hypothetical protein